MPTNTPKLNLLRIQDTWQFADEAFNEFIDDADNKLVGIAHLDSPAHWSTWEDSHSYVVGDVVRITNGKSHQYYQCTGAGISGVIEPANNVTGSVVNDGTVEWIVRSLSDPSSGGGGIQIWVSGTRYLQGDAVLYGTALYRCKVTHSSTNWNNDNNRWQEVFASIREWKSRIYYFAEDTVLKDDIVYKCIESHLAETTFNLVEEARWVALTDGRLKLWKVSTLYNLGDLVYFDSGYNWVIYKCIERHTSDSTNFYNDRDTKWRLFHTPSATIENWRTDVYYEAGQCVINGSRLYRCLASHTSVDFAVDKNSWMIVYSNLKDWQANYGYHKGETVVYNGNLYRANKDHTSSVKFSDDYNNWDKLLVTGIEPWETFKPYEKGDIVYENNVLYVCIEDHTSDTSQFENDRAKWRLFHKPSATIENWKSDKYYEENQAVLYNNTVYRCNVNHRSTNLLTGFEYDKDNWDIVYSNLKVWVTKVYYKEGSTVISHGNIYQCNTDHLSDDFDDATENTYWELISGGGSAIKEWEPNTKYNAGDLVIHNSILYRVDNDFISGPTFSDTDMTPLMGEPMSNDVIDDLWL